MTNDRSNKQDTMPKWLERSLIYIGIAAAVQLLLIDVPISDLIKVGLGILIAGWLDWKISKQ